MRNVEAVENSRHMLSGRLTREVHCSLVGVGEAEGLGVAVVRPRRAWVAELEA